MTQLSDYCPLCGADKFEWHEGEASDETILRFKTSIEEVYQKLKQLEGKEEI